MDSEVYLRINECEIKHIAPLESISCLLTVVILGILTTDSSLIDPWGSSTLGFTIISPTHIPTSRLSQSPKNMLNYTPFNKLNTTSGRLGLPKTSPGLTTHVAPIRHGMSAHLADNVCNCTAIGRGH
jgi:hypothetical protein